MKKYDGGKNGAGVFQNIINQIPPHSLYVEPFLGSGAILRYKRPADSTIGIDIDPRIVRAWTGREIPGLAIMLGDGLRFLERTTFPPSTFVYCDPPYPFSVRSCKLPMYRNEFTDEQHKRLLFTVRHLPCRVAISSYHSALYDQALHDWRHIEIKTIKRNGKPATEVVWFNYPEPSRLHDYRYLGNNYRERERIKLKIRRWIKNISRLPILEQQAIIDSIARAGTITGSGDAGAEHSPKH